MRTPACYISRLGSVTLPHALLNLLKYWFIFFTDHTHSKINIPVYTQPSGHGIAEANSMAQQRGGMLRKQGQKGNGKVGNNSTHGKPQQKAEDGTARWKCREGGRKGLHKHNWKAQERLAISGPEDKGAKEEETKLEYSKVRFFWGSPSVNTMF